MRTQKSNEQRLGLLLHPSGEQEDSADDESYNPLSGISLILCLIIVDITGSKESEIIMSIEQAQAAPIVNLSLKIIKKFRTNVSRDARLCPQ